MAQEKLLVEGCRNGRVHRTQISSQQYQRPGRSAIDEVTSGNYTLQAMITKSKEDAKRYRACNRHSEDPIELSREGSSSYAKEGWILQNGHKVH